MQVACVHGRHFNGRQPSGITQYFDCGMSLLLGGLMRRIKIPKQDIALEMEGGGAYV